MRVLILRATVANRQVVEPGSVHDLPDAEAKHLIHLGKARAVAADDTPLAPAPDPGLIDSSALGISDAPPKRGKRR